MATPTFESETIIREDLAAEDDTPMSIHLVCLKCHPGGTALGVPALCGEKMLGTALSAGISVCGISATSCTSDGRLVVLLSAARDSNGSGSAGHPDSLLRGSTPPTATEDQPLPRRQSP